MITKTEEKERAVALRKKGLSYGEILKEIKVAKSTLALWLKDVGLAKAQKQRLTQKRLEAALRGAIAKHNQRIVTTERIKLEAQKEIKNISDRELWLIGVALYWAEGSKQRDSHPSVEARFTNSDLLMIRLYLKWLQKICKVAIEDIKFEIYIHETGNIGTAKKYWANQLNLSVNEFQKIRLKKNKIKTLRKIIGENYHGLLRVTVRRSTILNRKITGWTEGICQNCGVV